MTGRFHSGELEVQSRAGVQFKAARLAAGIQAEIPPPALEFLREQRLAVAATVDAEGRVWVSPLSGEPGFLQAEGDFAIRIPTPRALGDPLAENLRRGGPIGLLILELETRRRMRVNGRAEPQGDGTFLVFTEQVYSNCPKYITRRAAEPRIPAEPEAARHGQALRTEQRAWIERLDTFFIGSVHPEAGADASHRGGPAGFVKAPDPRRIVFPDFTGNNLFQTLGNLAVSPEVGLLFVDFERGGALLVTGKARIEWVAEAAPGAPKRLVEVEVEAWIELSGALLHRFRPLDESQPRA